MANGHDGEADAETAPGGRRQRPPATIELSATEIAAAPDAAPSPDAATTHAVHEPEIAAPHQAEAALPDHPHMDPPASADVSTGSSHTASPPAGAPPIRRRRWRLAAGAAAVIVLGVAALWQFGPLAPRDTDTQELAAKIAQLELQMRELASRPVATSDAKSVGDLTARLDALTARLAKTESAAPARPAASDPALAERLAAAEAALRALTGNVSELRGRLDTLAATPTNPAAAPPSVERADIDAVAGRIAALETAIKAIDTRLSKPVAGADAPARLALVALELRVAVERGLSFAAELAAAKPLVADPTLLAPLEPVAATGVPTVQALARELSNVAPAMLHAAATPAHEGGLLERLQANAERLVRIRPIEEAPGGDPATVIVRAELKAGRGDTAGALAEILALPAEVRAPAAQWIKTAQTRVAVVDAARKLAANALEALGKPMP